MKLDCVIWASVRLKVSEERKSAQQPGRVHDHPIMQKKWRSVGYDLWVT